jgi:tetratricopeptide (TPR) repeat protein
MAPEVESHRDGTAPDSSNWPAIDVYAYAMTVWVVLTRSRKLSARGQLQPGSRPQISQIRDPEIRKMVEQAWQESPSDRQSFAEICEFWEGHKPQVIAEYREELDRKERELSRVDRREQFQMLETMKRADDRTKVVPETESPFGWVVSLLTMTKDSGCDNLPLILALNDSWDRYKYINRFVIMGRDRRMQELSSEGEPDIVRGVGLGLLLSGVSTLETRGIEILERYLKVWMPDMVILYTMGDYWRRKGNDMEAFKYFELAAETDPSQIDPLLACAAIRWTQKNHEDARSFLARALQVEGIQNEQETAIRALLKELEDARPAGS